MIKYLYICAAGHSGSTLLDRLLGSHSNIESLGEISRLPQNIKLNTLCTCGQPVRSCAVWQEVIKQMSLRLGIDILQTPYALHLGHITPIIMAAKEEANTLTNRLRKIFFHGLWFANLRFDIGPAKLFLGPVYEGIENNFILYDTVLSVLKARMIVDSSKHYLKATELYKRRPAEVRILHLTRDGRGVLYSALKRNFPPIPHIQGWRRHYIRGLSLFNRHVNPEHILQVKYEDIVANPPKELKRICGFIGTDYESGMLDFTAKPQHSTDGNNMRFSKSSEIRFDNAWQKNLSESDRNCFESIAGKLNYKLGYEYT
jgi:hypothetical protein